MTKLLITVTDPQNEWLREEASRLDLPGGVSELVRRIVDERRLTVNTTTTNDRLRRLWVALDAQLDLGEEANTTEINRLREKISEEEERSQDA